MKLYGGTTPFITIWKTDNRTDQSPPDATEVNQIRIPTFGAGYNYRVDWGDGNISENVTGDIVHTYGVEGIYTVSITGNFPRIYFNETGDIEKIISIEQWGDNEWVSFNRAFVGCVNLEAKFVDVPNLSNVTSTAYMFSSIKSINADLSNWDLSNVTEMQFMFHQVSGFNLDITNWDVSNVTNMAHIFEETNDFNQDISTWNISNVTDMSGMFNTTAFNQDISNWDVSGVDNMHNMLSFTPFNQDISNWNVSNVTNMQNMFAGSSFNQDISNWDVSSVTHIGAMFASSSFNQDIGNWDVSNVEFMQNMFRNSPFDQNISNWNISNVTTMFGMFEESKLSTANYDALLIGWNSRDLQQGINFDAGNSIYSCKSLNARENMITNDLWVINDGGAIGGGVPEIYPIENINEEGRFILPEIEGAFLSPLTSYYTEPNGNGTIYKPNDVIDFYDYESYPIILYAYEYREGCPSEESFELTITKAPLLCTTLITPLIGTKSYTPLDTDLTWNISDQATGYIISAGTISGGTDIIDNLDVGNVLTYDLPYDLPPSTQIYVSITPYNDYEEAMSCTEETFITVNTGIPKYFTPNNDGVNDIWRFPDPSKSVLNITIYNRYGKLLKQYTDATQGWDGTYLNRLLPTSDYWYVIQYRDGNVLQGHLSLKL